MSALHLQVVLTTRIRPPADSGQLPFSSTGVAKLTITGCPLSETPKPETTISEGFNVSTVVRYPWRVSSTSDITDTGTLSLQQGAKQDVSVSVEITRDPGQRSVALQGYVQLAAQGTRNLTATTVQVRKWPEPQAIVLAHTMQTCCTSFVISSTGLSCMSG